MKICGNVIWCTEMFLVCVFTNVFSPDSWPNNPQWYENTKTFGTYCAMIVTTSICNFYANTNPDTFKQAPDLFWRAFHQKRRITYIFLECLYIPLYSSINNMHLLHAFFLSHLPMQNLWIKRRKRTNNKSGTKPPWQSPHSSHANQQVNPRRNVILMKLFS